MEFIVNSMQFIDNGIEFEISFVYGLKKWCPETCNLQSSPPTDGLYVCSMKLTDLRKVTLMLLWVQNLLFHTWYGLLYEFL